MSKAFQNAQTLQGQSTTADTGEVGFWPDVSAGTRIQRMRDRLFVGDGAKSAGNRNGSQGTLFPNSSDGPNWLLRDSQLLSFTTQGLVGVTGIARSGDLDTSGGNPTESIGVAGFLVANHASLGGWAGYFEVQSDAGGAGGLGLEIVCKNKTGSSKTPTPYSNDFDLAALWLVAGGDPLYGGTANAPSDVAIAIGTNAASGQTWNRGIVFFDDSLTRGPTYATAIELAKNHIISWRTTGNFAAFDLYSDVSAENKNVKLIAQNDRFAFLGGGNAVMCKFDSVGTTGVNYIGWSNAATGSPPSVSAVGTDTDVDLKLGGQNAGLVRFGTWTTSGDVAVSGYITIKDSGGTVRKLAVIT